MKRLAALFILGACASPQLATPQQKNEAIKTWFDCMTIKAVQFDDHQSDAGSIALGIMGLCHTDFMESVRLQLTGTSPALQTNLKAKLLNDELPMATSVVLTVRSPQKR